MPFDLERTMKKVRSLIDHNMKIRDLHVIFLTVLTLFLVYRMFPTTININTSSPPLHSNYQRRYGINASTSSISCPTEVGMFLKAARLNYKKVDLSVAANNMTLQQIRDNETDPVGKEPSPNLKMVMDEYNPTNNRLHVGYGKITWGVKKAMLSLHNRSNQPISTCMVIEDIDGRMRSVDSSWKPNEYEGEKVEIQPLTTSYLLSNSWTPHLYDNQKTGLEVERKSNGKHVIRGTEITWGYVEQENRTPANSVVLLFSNIPAGGKVDVILHQYHTIGGHVNVRVPELSYVWEHYLDSCEPTQGDGGI